MLKDIPITIDMLKAIAEDVTGDDYFLPGEELFTGKTLSGKGQLRFKNGNQYAGDISNGIIEGEGVFLWKDGVSYKGGFVNNTMEGHGTYEWPDGSTYVGSIRNGLRDGTGTFKSSAGKELIVYTGDWKEGLKHGHGEMTYANSG